jgi:hypothetical protein
MKKKQRTRVPEFARPPKHVVAEEQQDRPSPPKPVRRIKPQSTSAKSGRRGQ